MGAGTHPIDRKGSVFPRGTGRFLVIKGVHIASFRCLSEEITSFFFPPRAAEQAAEAAVQAASRAVAAQAAPSPGAAAQAAPGAAPSPGAPPAAEEITAAMFLVVLEAPFPMPLSSCAFLRISSMYSLSIRSSCNVQFNPVNSRTYSISDAILYLPVFSFIFIFSDPDDSCISLNLL